MSSCYADSEYFKIGRLYYTPLKINIWLFLGEVVYRNTPQMRDSDFVFLRLNDLTKIKLTKFQTIGLLELV